MDRLMLSDTTKAALRDSLVELNLTSPYNDIETFLVTIYPIFAQLPPDVLLKLSAYRNNPRAYGALLIQNFPQDDNLPPTPTDGGLSRNKNSFISEACVLGVSQLLGQPMGYHDEREGQIIQALCPVKHQAHAPSSESSERDLGFHTDFSFDKDNPDQPFNILNTDYIVLFCLRADRKHEAYTLYADARDICRKLTSTQLEIMRKPLFQFAASYSFTGKCGSNRIWSAPCPLLKGPDEFPEISVDLLCGVRGLTDEALGSLELLKEICGHSDVSTGACLKPGELLLIDNRKGVHARTAFAAHFDGRDRWLHRVYVRRSLWEVRKSSNESLRVF
jgi:L-asparagine oxygenase